MNNGYRERKVLKLMRPYGYDGVRSAGSFGKWDVVLWKVRKVTGDIPPYAKAALILIQVKCSTDPIGKIERDRLVMYSFGGIWDPHVFSKQIWTFPVKQRGAQPVVEFVP